MTDLLKRATSTSPRLPSAGPSSIPREQAVSCLRVLTGNTELTIPVLCYLARFSLVAGIPVLRGVFWGLRRRLLRGSARRREGTIPIDSAGKVHGGRNRQEARDRAHEQRINLESQQ